MRTIKTWLVLGMACALAACASKGADRVTDAATRPLGDLNLVREEIPDVLRQAQAKPYQLPAEVDCASLVQRVHELDHVLGADLDTPPTKENPGLIERGSDAAGDAAIGALARTADGLIPFRGWVRKLSGAERHSRKVEAAIAAGTVRRAFLKGSGDHQRLFVACRPLADGGGDCHRGPLSRFGESIGADQVGVLAQVGYGVQTHLLKALRAT